MGFEPTTSCIRGKRLTARPQGPHGREQTGGAFVEKNTFKELIFASVLYVLYREALVV